MGMYTELFLQVKLNDDVPSDVIKTLKHMINNNEKERPDIPPFSASRWEWMLQSSSYYHYPHAHSFLDEPNFETDSYHLFIRCDFKNYNGELEGFLTWIAPYVEEQSEHYQGHHFYEEADSPTRIRFYDGKVDF
jgi:hypothetical protein